MKKRNVIISSMVVISVVLITAGILMKQQSILKERQLEQQEQKEKLLQQKIKESYSQKVITSKKSPLYKKVKKRYHEVGTIAENILLFLEENGAADGYFSIANSPYYISYDSIKASTTEKEDRYKSYIPFNLVIKTKPGSTFYKEEKSLFNIEESLELGVIVNTDTYYGVEMFDQLVYLKKEDVLETEEKEITTEESASSLSAILYHFIYLQGEECPETICHPEDQVKSHFSYLKEENFFTVTPQEVSAFIDGSIQLPKKSLLITIDDGARAEKFIPFLETFGLQATLFLVSSWYPKEQFASPYLTVASHTHDMHTTGVCPTGQGGGINCLPKEQILKDLKASRDTLDQTTALSYPFFEYSNYAIELVKEAGFKIAFIGGQKQITKGIDKYKVPRFTIFSTTTLENFKKMVNS